MDVRKVGFAELGSIFAIIVGLTVVGVLSRHSGYNQILQGVYSRLIYKGELFDLVLEGMRSSGLILLVAGFLYIVVMKVPKRFRTVVMARLALVLGAVLVSAAALFFGKKDDLHSLLITEYLFLASSIFFAGVAIYYRQRGDHMAVYWSIVSFILYVVCMSTAGKFDASYAMASPHRRYNIYTQSKDYINVVVLRSNPNGIVVLTGNDLVFHPLSDVKRMSTTFVKGADWYYRLSL